MEIITSITNSFTTYIPAMLISTMCFSRFSRMKTKFSCIELTTGNEEQDVLFNFFRTSHCNDLHKNATWRKASEYQSYAASPVFSVTTEIWIL